MDFVLPFSPLVLTFVMIAACLGAMWWLLRSESWRTLVLVGILTAIGLSLRLFQIEALPPGLNDDEIKTLAFANEVVGGRRIFRPILNVPMFWTALFYFPFLSVSGSVFWTMRVVPVLLGTLAIPVAFSIGRSLSFGIVSSLVGAACVASMPWAIFWSRQHWASGIVFFEAILVSALARLVWRHGGWMEVSVATLGLCGVLYDYTGGWAMAVMPIVAAMLASSIQQRIKCGAVLIAGLILWMPWLLQTDSWLHIVSSKSIGGSGGFLSGEFLTGFVNATRKTLRTFVYPEGTIYWTSLQGVAMHPIMVLVAAALGLVCCMFRRALFLGIGFFGGMMPTIMSSGTGASGHRMISCYLFISLAVGALFEFFARMRGSIRYQVVVAVVATMFMVVASIQSMQIFLSNDFWKGSEGVFWYGATKISESVELPATRPVVVDFETSRFLKARNVPNPGYVVLSHENWMPTSSVEYDISPPLSFILPLYREALPESHITVFGSGPTMAFRATFDDRDVAEWRKYGWSAEALCGDQSLMKGQLPAVVFGTYLPWSWRCYAPQTIVYRGMWAGPPTDLTLWLVGAFDVQVEVASGFKIRRTPNTAKHLNFTVTTNDEVTIVANLQNGFQMRLLEGRDGIGEIVRLRNVEPLSQR
jgi:hypothetical protein